MPRALVLGAGINGIALARELVLNRLDVDLVDLGDIAGGTTACSSHLIHGGLRYLEYGDFALVRESLAERGRLLRLAPQFVQPLRLFIPLRRRLGGFRAAAAALMRRRAPARAAANPAPRGLWLVRLGLWLYDSYARDRTLPRASVHRADEPAAVPLAGGQFRWQAAYSDGLIQFPERFVLALLTDAAEAAAAQGTQLRVFTYHEASTAGPSILLSPRVPRGCQSSLAAGPPPALAPDVVINATGAWVDETLRKLSISHKRLIGGTKGSHLVTYHQKLIQTLAGRGIYAEARDGRPVFILPWGDAVLIGTTDLPYDQPPESAVAADEEIDYLLAAVNDVLGEEALRREDIAWHYSGVRPLPYADAATPAAISRGHWLVPIESAPWPMYAIVGGKLTACRSLAQSSAATILRGLHLPVTADSAQRTIPGGEDFPRSAEALALAVEDLAARHGLAREQAAAAWRLHGTRAPAVFASCRPQPGDTLCDTPFPTAYVRWIIRHEWVRTIDDLALRRLMLLYHRGTLRTWRHLAGLLAEEGLLDAQHAPLAADQFADRIRRRHGYVS